MLEKLEILENKWYMDMNLLNKEKSSVIQEHKFINWLTKPYILSKSMKLLCNNLTVTVIQQQKDYILRSEREILKINNSKTPDTYVRKVYISGDNIPWEYARVVVPTTTYTTYKETFESLGGKLIGETLLYNNPRTTRSNFEYTKLTAENYVYQELAQYIPESLNNLHNDTIYGRRSIFYIDGTFPLLISEFFLPAIPEYQG